MEALGRRHGAAKVVNYIGLAGLVASFFSIIYAYSRQTFALSRAGYLPTALSVTNSRKAPTLALIVPGVIGFALSLTGKGAMLLNMAVFGAAVSYVLMMVSHIVLRKREPDMPRPYRTPGGIVTTGFALVIAVAAVIATFLVDPTAALWTLVAFGAFMAYFGFYSRHHLVANSPDEEFALLAKRKRNWKWSVPAQQIRRAAHLHLRRSGRPDGKATPLRSGDELAGCAAASDAERAAAQWALAEVPLDHIPR